MNTIIKFDNVSKKYRIRHKDVHNELRIDAKSRNFLDIFKFGLNGRFRKENFWALTDVSFEIKKGETVGIIGPNGAGKSTILKLLTGISRPERGHISVEGKIGALVELGAGFHSELTGRENIYLNASILGLKKKEIDGKFDQIVEFAELEQFIDTPVKRYSSGMYVRLGFSVAVHIDPDILFVDEVLAVGDKAFQRKSFEKLNQFKRDGKTFILVSHSLFQVENICDRGIYLNQGKVVVQGDVKNVISRYVADTIAKSKKDSTDFSSGEIRLTDVRIIDESGAKTEDLYTGQPFAVEIDYEANSAVDSPTFVFTIRYGEFRLFSTSTKATGNDFGKLKGRGTIKCYMKNLPLMPNSYEIDVTVWDKQQIRLFSSLSNKASLNIKSPSNIELFPYLASGNLGVVYGFSEWSKR